jgi:hypothetical protein
MQLSVNYVWLVGATSLSVDVEDSSPNPLNWQHQQHGLGESAPSARILVVSSEGDV